MNHTNDTLPSFKKILNLFPSRCIVHIVINFSSLDFPKSCTHDNNFYTVYIFMSLERIFGNLDVKRDDILTMINYSFRAVESSEGGGDPA